MVVRLTRNDRSFRVENVEQLVHGATFQPPHNGCQGQGHQQIEQYDDRDQRRVFEQRDGFVGEWWQNPLEGLGQDHVAHHPTTPPLRPSPSGRDGTIVREESQHDNRGGFRSP